MKKRNIFLVFCVAAMILTAGIGRAWAYFTTYAEARGGYTIELGDETEIKEEFSAWVKSVTVSNKEDAKPVYIRVKAFAGAEYNLSYSGPSGKWTPGADGFYYYSDIVNGGAATDELLIKIGGVPGEIKDPAEFNVAVIYESTPVRYQEDGTPYADWDAVFETGDAEGGAEG